MNSTTTGELRQLLLLVWRGLEQSLIDDVVDQWPTRMRACVRASGGHFEYILIVTVNLFYLYLINFMFYTTLDALNNILIVNNILSKNVLPAYSSAKPIKANEFFQSYDHKCTATFL